MFACSMVNVTRRPELDFNCFTKIDFSFARIILMYTICADLKIKFLPTFILNQVK